MKCSQCGICCKLFFVNLTEKEYKSKKYKTQFDDFPLTADFEEAELCGANILSQKEDGSCIYLQKGKCSIHKFKPQSCRNFFCKDTPHKKMIEKINAYKNLTLALDFGGN